MSASPSSPSHPGAPAEAHHPVLRFPGKLYGRERNAASMMRIFERVCAGHGAVLLVPGYSGVGKTSLVRQLHAPVEARNGFFLAGKFDQYRQYLPTSPCSRPSPACRAASLRTTKRNASAGVPNCHRRWAVSEAC